MNKPDNQTDMHWMRHGFLWGGLLIGITWILYRLLNNTGWILDDEISHYLFSRSVWENHEQLFNHWTRPGRNFVHFPFAVFGFTATRLYTFGLALITLWVTMLAGRKLEVRAVWAIPVLLLFQSWFPELSYPVLTQTPFMLFWILGVWFGLNKKYWHLAGFCFGYLSLIRHEGILITGLWGLWVIFQSGGFARTIIDCVRGDAEFSVVPKALFRDAIYGVSTVSPILIYNLAAYLTVGTIPFNVYFETNPTDMYGSGSIFHYVPLLIGGVGLVSLILAGLGLCTLKKLWGKWSLLLITYIAYFVMHSLIYWKGAFASGGYYHFLMPMAPAFALLGARFIGEVLYCEGFPLPRKACVSVLLLVVVAQGLNMPHHQLYYQDWQAVMAGDAKPEYSALAKPMKKGELSRCVVEASEWATGSYPEGTLVIASHIAHPFTQEILATKENQDKQFAKLHDMPVGTVFIWDMSYSDLENRTRYESFTESRDWKAVRTWEKAYPDKNDHSEKAKYVVVVFEKISKKDTQDKVYEEAAPKDEYDKAYGGK